MVAMKIGVTFQIGLYVKLLRGKNIMNLPFLFKIKGRGILVNLNSHCMILFKSPQSQDYSQFLESRIDDCLSTVRSFV